MRRVYVGGYQTLHGHGWEGRSFRGVTERLWQAGAMLATASMACE